MERISIDKYYLDIAVAVARRSTCLKKQYGAVIVNNGEIISTGYNGSCRGEPECKVCTKMDINKDESEYLTCPAVHAEQNAIISASRRDMLNAVLYLAGIDTETGLELAEPSPCGICLRLIKNAGLKAVITRQGIIYSRDSNGLLKKN